MPTHAEIKILTQDGQTFGTKTPVLGDIRDIVEQLMVEHFNANEPYPTRIVSNPDEIKDLTASFAKITPLQFVAEISDLVGMTERCYYNKNNLDSFIQDTMEGIPVWQIETQGLAFDSPCLPEWISHVWNLKATPPQNGQPSRPINEHDLNIFIRYCQLFEQQKILFGYQTSKIKSITLTLTPKGE